MQQQGLVLGMVAASVAIVMLVSRTRPPSNPEHFAIDSPDLVVYLINLDRNHDRLVTFLKMYWNSDLGHRSFFRMSAVDGKTLKLSDFVTSTAFGEIAYAEKTGHRLKHYQLTRGGVGCYMSHMMILKHFVDSGRELALVFEDDALFTQQVSRDITAALRDVPGDWDMLVFGPTCNKCENVSAKLVRVQRWWGTHCVLVSRKGAQKIMAHISDERIQQQIDAVYGDMVAAGKLVVYGVPDVVKQNAAFPTTIQVPVRHATGVDPHAPAMFTSSSGVRS